MSETKFEDIGLSPELVQAVSDMNYTQATGIQAQAIPLLMQGADVIGRSSTGTGKTAAFGIPAVERIEKSVLKEVYFLDTVPPKAGVACDKIKYLSVAHMFAEAIERIYEEVSVSKLFV